MKRIILLPLNMVLNALGVNVNHFWALLGAKLKMDFRRVPNSFQSSGKKQTLLKQLIIYSVLGGVMVLSLYRIPDLILQLSIFFSFLIVYEGTILLTEFTSVLFDERENQILLPRPVNSRTLLLVRLVHILVYMGNIAFALSMPFAIYLAVNYGFLAILFMISALLCAWFTLLLSVGFYMTLSRFVCAERFKDVLNYFQIGLAIVIMASYQLIPNFIDEANMEQLAFRSEWWSYFIPSVWFAGFTRFIAGIGVGTDVYLALIVVLVTIAGSLVLIRALAGGFTSIISEAGADSSKPARISKVKSQKNWLSKLVSLLCVSNVERTGWDLAMSHVRSDRKFKQQVLPMFVYSIIMVIVFLRPSINDFSAYIAELGDSFKYVMFILAAYFGTVGISVLPYTDTPEAVWVYEVASTRNKFHIQSGAVKAMLFTFYLPLYLLYLVPIIWIWGVSVVPYIVIGASLSACLAIVSVRIQKNALPFTEARDMVNKGTYTLRMFLGMTIIGLIIGLIYLLTFLHVGVSIALCALMPVLISLSYRTIRNRK